MGGGPDGPDRHGHPSSAHAAVAAVPRSRQGGHAAGRHQALERSARRRGKGGMTRRVLAGLGCALALALAGCSSAFDSSKVDYKAERKLPPLDVPPDLTTPARDDRYPIPDTNKTPGPT